MIMIACDLDTVTYHELKLKYILPQIERLNHSPRLHSLRIPLSQLCHFLVVTITKKTQTN